MKKRILLATPLYPPQTGGPATLASQLVEHLPKDAFTIDLLPFSRVRGYPLVIRHIAYFLLALKHGKQVTHIFALDALSVGWSSAFAYWFLMPFMNVSFVVRFPGDQVWEQGVQRFGVTVSIDNFPRWSWMWNPYLMLLRMFQCLTLWSASCVIVPSSYLGEIVERLGVKHARIVVIPNAFEKGSADSSTIQQVLHAEGKVVLTAGRLVPWKGFGVLIDVAKELEHPDGLVLAIVGDGPLRKKLEEKIKRERLEARVRLLPAVSRATLLGYMRSADVFVLNTEYEGFSHTILEAMSVGAAIVTTKIGGNRDVIRDQEEGLLVPYNDRVALRDAIRSLLDESTMRARLMKTAEKTAGQFTEERMIGAYTTFFTSLP